ncbi:MAG: SAM-dependent DNA methyltransferase [Nitrospinota bacterium]
MPNAKQVKSKKRVTDHGEVFTSAREVNAMLDLVKQETERIDSRFLEPACGDGNFLAEILSRKLTVVESRYSKSQIEFERYAVIAVSSIYGVDILEDNVADCRQRLFNIFDEKYSSLYKSKCQEECRQSIKFILSRNILWGDALNLKNPEDKKPIIFSEWSAVNGSMIKRRDFMLAFLLDKDKHQITLFSDENDPTHIPQPIEDFPLTHFLKLGQDDNTKL